MQTLDRLMPMKEVRVLLGGVCNATVYNMINRGELPRPIKIGSRSMWLNRDVSQAIKDLDQQRSVD